jgi:signal transduction histidine kinase
MDLRTRSETTSARSASLRKFAKLDAGDRSSGETYVSSPQLLLHIATTAASATTFHQAINSVLDLLCATDGWSVGNAWLKRDSDQWVSANLWHISLPTVESSPRSAVFAQLTEWTDRHLAGNVTDVIASRFVDEPDVSIGTRNEARPYDLRAAVAFPITVDDEAIGFVTLFSQRRITTDRSFENLLLQAGTLLGQVFTRSHRERSIVAVCDSERRRISAELHDGLSQQLAAISMLMGSLHQRLVNEGSSQSDNAAKVLAALEEAKQQARGLCSSLMPVRVAPNALAGALCELAHATENTRKVSCSFACDVDPWILDEFMATQLLHLVRDAVAYLCSQRGTSRISITLTAENGISLIIDGNGRIGTVSATQSVKEIETMKARVYLVGGDLSVSESGRGISVVCKMEPRVGEQLGPACAKT